MRFEDKFGLRLSSLEEVRLLLQQRVRLKGIAADSSALEEVRLLQQQRVRLKGIAADGALTGAEGAEGKGGGGAGAQGEAGEEGEGGEELVLQDTFAQETAITVEDPNMYVTVKRLDWEGGKDLVLQDTFPPCRGGAELKYIEEELAKRRGGGAGAAGGSRGEVEGEDEVLRAEDKLYEIPQHLQVEKLEGEEGGTAWTTGIAEVQLPIDYKLGNIEATEEAKRMMQERRPWMNRPRPPSTTLPASYSADFFQRGREYAEKLKRANNMPPMSPPLVPPAVPSMQTTPTCSEPQKGEAEEEGETTTCSEPQEGEAVEEGGEEEAEGAAASAAGGARVERWGRRGGGKVRHSWQQQVISFCRGSGSGRGSESCADSMSLLPAVLVLVGGAAGVGGWCCWCWWVVLLVLVGGAAGVGGWCCWCWWVVLLVLVGGAAGVGGWCCWCWWVVLLVLVGGAAGVGGWCCWCWWVVLLVLVGGAAGVGGWCCWCWWVVLLVLVGGAAGVGGWCCWCWWVVLLVLVGGAAGVGGWEGPLAA
ncbi:unnamed protein product [Closterium sp. Naga37s-1]|nr:unnamed protein product [Closterium sp. Naga37s-1]